MRQPYAPNPFKQPRRKKPKRRHNADFDDTDKDESVMGSDLDASRSGFSDSDASRFGIDHKGKDENSACDLFFALKMTNVIVYNATLCIAVGYFRTMQFRYHVLYQAFMTLLLARPVLILIYSLVSFFMQTRRQEIAENGEDGAKLGARKESASDISGSDDMSELSMSKSLGSFYGSSSKVNRVHSVKQLNNDDRSTQIDARSLKPPPGMNPEYMTPARVVQRPLGPMEQPEARNVPQTHPKPGRLG